MRCLVTGAAGFIGSHLCEELVGHGHDVTAFIHYNSRDEIGNLCFLPKCVSRKIKIIKGDIQDPFSVEAAVRGNTHIFHLAALIGIPYSYLAPASYVSINVNGTLNILEASKKCKVKKVVHTSTSETYGSALYTPIDEKHPLQGQSPYSASKIGADQLAESYYRSFDLPVAIIRPFNTFGPRQSARAVIPTIIMQLLAGYREIKLGDITPVRDFNYIKDTVSGFMKVGFNANSIGRVLNIGSGHGYTMKKAFDIINRLAGTKARIVHDKTRIRPAKSEVRELLCDFKTAQKTVGYVPVWTFEDGLRATIEFIRENLSLYNLKEYVV